VTNLQERTEFYLPNLLPIFFLFNNDAAYNVMLLIVKSPLDIRYFRLDRYFKKFIKILSKCLLIRKSY